MEDKFNGGTVSVSNEGSGGTLSFYDNSIEGWCTLHLTTKTDAEYETLKKVLIDNSEVIFSDFVEKDFLIDHIEDGPEITFNEDMYGYYGDSSPAVERLEQLEELCGFKLKYLEIFAGKRVSYNFIMEKPAEENYPNVGQWYELDDEDYCWAISDCMEDGEVYLGERSTLRCISVAVSNKKTGDELYTEVIEIETDAFDDEVYEKLSSNDFYLKCFAIPIADSIEQLYSKEWRQEFYDLISKDDFLEVLNKNDIDTEGLSIDDLSFELSYCYCFW